LRRRRVDNIAAVDRFTLGHGAVGFCLGLWRMPWYSALAASVVFEIVENFVLKPAIPALFPVGTRDSFANATMDTVAWMAGWGAGHAIPAPREETPALWRRGG
jgi:hypothetical protein